ncbi:MAG: D-alanyl-D-alanine carboxypeptidase/D-alanyl-D-alanine-endopeptidase [Candidatus Eremiobacteraeota bacterium]|nr:D-alanyl-D-alanine carboxypeptidase/D-alanyl-D-alanine-endopeptidase [Candidatus Eremiobacteraeota bacterium]
MFRLLLCAIAFFTIVSGTARAADQSLVTPYPLQAVQATPWNAAQTAVLGKDIDAILRRPVLRGAHIGLLLMQTTTGRILYNRNADDEFMPASNFKLLVGSAALAKLGPSFTLKTTIAGDGKNIYLRGGGDVLLKAKDLDAAAAALAAGGLSHITGNLITDASYFDAQRYGYGWSWDDLPFYYAPVVSALGLEDNIVHIYMRPGAAAGDPVLLRVEPKSEAVHIKNLLVTGPPKSKDTSDISRSFEDWSTITLSGNYPLGEKESGDIFPAVPDPAAYAGDVLLQALRAHGITVDGAVQPGITPPATAVLWTHESEPLSQLLEDFWWPSDNLVGEVLLKTLGAKFRGAPGTYDNGIAVENEYLKSIGVDPTTVSISDGSGLSHYNHITPRDLTSILQSDWNSANRDVAVNALPLSGVRGSLKSSYLKTPAMKNVYAKTGSISHVRTISGLIRTQHHGVVTFSFMLDDYMDDPADAAAKLATLRGDLFSRIVAAP